MLPRAGPGVKATERHWSQGGPSVKTRISLEARLRFVALELGCLIHKNIALHCHRLIHKNTHCLTAGTTAATHKI
jgi:hypothetical protein